MEGGGIAGLCILGAVVALVLFMLIRAAVTKPQKEEEQTTAEGGGYTPIEVDDTVAEHLSEAVKIRTVSIQEEGGDYSAFDEYEKFLENTYPVIHKTAEKTVVNGHALIFRIAGSDESLLPACYLSHQDVVPAREEEWSIAPFDGIIKDGYVYGRGSLDMKGHMIALLEGLEKLLAEKQQPKRSIYLCFGFDEELTGVNGACKIVEYLAEKGVKMEYVIDEGGVIMDGSMLGVNQKIAAIGTCEKGYIDVKLTATRAGGHASSPKKRSSVDEVAEAVFYLSHLPMRAYFSKPVKETFKSIAPHMKFGYKLLFVNSDILAPLLKLVLTKLNPVTNSLLRTTFAFTCLKGSDANNVVPNTASAVVNVRTNMGQTNEEVLKYIKKAVGKDIDVSVIGRAFEPVISDEDKKAFKAVEKAVKEVFGFISIPYPFMAASDAKYYNKICDNVVRFGPLEMELEDQDRIHSKDERCKVDSLKNGVKFFHRLIENTCY